MSQKRLNITFPVKCYPYRVFYADTDAGGVVYYGQYLRIFEQMRAYYAEEFDLSLKEMHDRNCVFVCKRAEIDYHSPAILDDQLDVEIWISETGGTFLTFNYEIACSSRSSNKDNVVKIASGITKMVACRSENGFIKITRIPDWIWEKFAGKQ